ncbi:MAG: hypothetical protein ACLVG5_10980 [Clostridium sp.]
MGTYRRSALAEPLGLTLPEIHAAYDEKIYETLAEKAMQPMTFPPGLVIDAIESRRGTHLAAWAKKVWKEGLHGQHAHYDGIPLLDLKDCFQKEIERQFSIKAISNWTIRLRKNIFNMYEFDL